MAVTGGHEIRVKNEEEISSCAVWPSPCLQPCALNDDPIDRPTPLVANISVNKFLRLKGMG